MSGGWDPRLRRRGLAGCQPRPATRRTANDDEIRRRRCGATVRAVHRTWRPTWRALQRRAGAVYLTAPAASGVGRRRFETVPDTAMKPRPLDFGCGPASAAAAAGCAGWAWRPTPWPRGGGRAPRVSPKCSHSGAAAGAAHSEDRRREVVYRPVELPETGFGSEVEARIERVIFACRFMTFLGIGGLLLGSVPCFLKGCVSVMNAFVEYLNGGGQVILMLLEAIEMYLIGTVTFVLGIGLYELFISTIDSSYGSNLFGLFSLPDRPKWVEIKSLDDLKTKLGHVIVLVLLVGIFEKSKRVTITSCTDLLCFAGSIFLSSICLYLLSRLNTSK